MRYISTIIIFSFLFITVSAQSKGAASTRKKIDSFLREYKTDTNKKTSRLVSYQENSRTKTVVIKATESLGNTLFRPKIVESLKSDLRKLLPAKIRNYKIKIYAGGYDIEELIPNVHKSSYADAKRQTEKIVHKDESWVTNVSKPYKIEKGLSGRHLAVGQSHGKYYKNEEGIWKWQRPNLFCTNEDIFTQSFVLQYVHPMLENAGAIIYTPRERDIQRNQSVVDNDDYDEVYKEKNSEECKWIYAPKRGYSNDKKVFVDGENPFSYGSVRMVRAERKGSDNVAYAQYSPEIPEEGEYAVYVSYQTVEKSVNDARYTVFHKGGKTEFKVNQRMGGSTWVYLGTFYFDKGRNPNSMVMVSNESDCENGYISTDAVRFGGGMCCVEREGKLSGLPKYLEGARYYALWSGFPLETYSEFEGQNDYSDDVAARSKSINYLCGGSVYNPSNEGLKVPIELSVSVHSDAGYSKIDNLIGTLGICTTNHNDGLLAAGTHRLSSRDLSDMIISQIQEDINHTYKANWPIRGIWDKNYSESRRPEVPSTIIELLSHQNFADLRYGHNPRFKFVVGRAIYKSILKYLAQKNNTEYVVQPLPVNSFSAEFGERENTVYLNWKSTVDKQEVSAISSKYVVYTSTDGVSFDNGTVVNSTNHTVKILPGKIYSFKVTALNDGGESFPSEVLSVHKSMTEKAVVMIVNGFDKISEPTVVDNENEAGFDVVNGTDISYMKNITTCGNQMCFDRSLGGGEGAGSLGHSNDDMIDVVSAGNTFNYPYRHGQSIAMAKDYSFVSCSKEAVEKNYVDLNKYEIVNYILGLQGQSAGGVSTDKTFSNKMQGVIDEYCRLGGNLLVSGAYIASDMSNTDEDKFFISNVLKLQLNEGARKYDDGLYGLTLQFNLFSERNPKIYRVPTIDAITPVKGAIAVLGFNDTGQACGIAYNGKYKIFALSFPFESISTKRERDVLMASILNYFMKK